jgi:UTP--glucose-1-phosphate uridylyltransferase
MGMRFLPATKAIPKEMLPIVDKPTIQYVVEEAVQSGLKEVTFVTSSRKTEIENHFDYDYKLEHRLREQGKQDLLAVVQEISRMITVSSVRQKEPLGLGHAILITRALIGEEPFAVFLGDDIMVDKVPCMKQLLDVYETRQASVLAVQEVPQETISRYGVVAVEPVEPGEDRVFAVKDMVEKPAPEKAPSNLAVIGRYVLTPTIFPFLEKTKPGAGGEIQLTDGLRGLIEKEPVYAYRFQGVRYDAGNKLEYLMATVEFALQREDLGEQFRSYLKDLKL